MRITIFKRGDISKITSNFSVPELECKCGNCPYTLIDLDHVLKLQNLRDAVGSPIVITSFYRCWNHNFISGGKPNSMHLTGCASDIQMPERKLNTFKNFFEKFDGYGHYQNFIHLDSRGYEKARWNG